MEDDTHNYLTTIMFRGTPCSICKRVNQLLHNVYSVHINLN